MPKDDAGFSIATASTEQSAVIEIRQTGVASAEPTASGSDKANLDLWISHKLVSANRGTLSAITDIKNRKRFVITLPLLEQKDAVRVLTPSTF